jgi:hypothetical protein
LSSLFSFIVEYVIFAKIPNFASYIFSGNTKLMLDWEALKYYYTITMVITVMINTWSFDKPIATGVTNVVYIFM